MVKYSFSSDIDQHDAKQFKETLGTFGTTTTPGGNQLQELQTKVRQGVKHVELHLSSRGKGGFGALDTPDKYGFEERRTIMQLAKLNKQTLSVHSSMEITSLSGLDQNGFNEVTRLEALKEMDETINFAAQTTKGGAIVMHLQGEGLNQSRSELVLSKKYLKWLKDNGREDEITRLKKDYLVENPLNRLFVDNPDKRQEAIYEYSSLSEADKNQFRNKYSEKLSTGKDEWEVYFLEKQKEKRKLSPELNPMVVVGDQMTKVERAQEFVDLNVLNDTNNILTQEDKDNLLSMGVRTGKEVSIEDFQKAMAIFSNGTPTDLDLKVSANEYKELKKKLFIDYDKVLSENNYLQNQADSEYFKKTTNLNLGILDLQKKNLQIKHSMFKDELKRVKDLEWENREALAKLENIDNTTDEGKAARDLIKIHISEKNKEIQHLKYNAIGQEEYHALANYDETIADINKKKKDVSDKLGNVTSLAEASFDKNISGVAFLGIKALDAQLDLIEKGEKAKEFVPELKNEINKLENEYKNSPKEKQDELFDKILKKKQQLRKWVGMKDYVDKQDGIDLENRPLYVAPENMLPGMGSLTSIEEYKAVLRMGQAEFAKKLLSDDKTILEIKKKYEKITGKQIKTQEDALKLAKKHLAGTFDSAHAAAWLKHFKKEEGESEESKLDRFNKWINNEAEMLVKEGLVKHIHFNNSTGKDDDHNLLSSGVLDMHDMRKRLRKAGVKEALIVEAGGRGANKNLHLLSAFETFNPAMSYNGQASSSSPTSSGVSDWISTRRDYENRPQYSQYGMGYSTFKHTPPQQGREKGNWSGTGFF